MSQVAVEKIHEEGSESGSLFEEMENLAARVRQRAFDIFKHRDRDVGSELEDWFKAEQELIFTPQSDLVEKDGKFELQVAVPGFDAKDVNVTALASAVVVRANSTHKHEKTEGNVCFCDFGERKLFRQFDLPAAIDVDKVTANLDKGILKLTAVRAETPAVKNIAVTA